MAHYRLVKPYLLMVLGVQGSGKGTQAAKLGKALGVPVVVAGDLFRAEAAKGTPLGREIQARFDTGELMTIDIWDAVMRTIFQEHEFRQGIILDGFLRSQEQENHFEKVAAELNLPEVVIIHLMLDDETAIARLRSRGRFDDTEPAIRRRLSWSRSQSEPVIEKFRSHGKVLDIDASAPIETVFQEIMSQLLQAGVVA